ncbi:RNA polymerase sigma factor [Puniceicoccaceae bacterium K14]|nr:RNA polymerase sigma factor [Puniceicoccaceae bacterium K14]
MSNSPAAGFNAAEAETLFARRLELVSESVDLYHIYLKDYLYRLTSQWQDAENLLQDLWQHVLLHFPEEKIKVLPILRRKAWQIFIDFYRARQRRGETITDEVAEGLITHVSIEAYTDREEQSLKETFWNGFPGIELDDQQKEVIWMHARFGFTYKEIEEKIGIPSSTVCDWVALARERLATYLNNQK